MKEDNLMIEEEVMKLLYFIVMKSREELQKIIS